MDRAQTDVDLLQSTLKPSPRRGSGARWRVPALTILFHPDVRRVGGCARLVGLLEGRREAVTRSAPSFATPGAGSGEPLAHRSVSRRKLWLEAAGGRVRLQCEPGVEVSVDGTPAAPHRDLSAGDLERGAVIELGERVVLLLHLLGPPAEPLPRFGLVGDSEPIERVRADIDRVAGLEVTVLLRGESGTGKELVARAIQLAGPRARAPFVSVNMAAIPPGVAASELFGHSAGAFTGAARAHAGYFAQAHGGTLFLDEVGEAPPDLQAMLLRALETQETQPLGATSRMRADVRVIAATDSDLEAAVRDGRFREALLHRLAGYEIVLPPLRERRDDIGRLLFHRLALELRALGEEARLARLDGPEPWLPAALVARLARHGWPGNVRQLCNVARHLAIASRGGRTVTPDALPRGLLEEGGAERPARRTASRNASAPGAQLPSEEELLNALGANGWRTCAAARALGISRTTLYKLIDRSAAIRKARDLSAEEILGCSRDWCGDVEAMAAALQVSPRGLRLRIRELRADAALDGSRGR